MPAAGFRDINGVAVPFSEIDVVRDAHRFNCSPATLAMLIDSTKGREGIEFSASMLAKPQRQLLLEAGDYYPTTGQMMKAHMGTMKHQQINVNRAHLIVERRFTSKRNPRLSGQIDHAAIVELTNDGELVVDLYDLKTVAWYSATLIQKDVWKHHSDYAWQLNLCAAMMEETTVPCSTCDFTGLCWDCAGCDECDGGIGPHACPYCRGEARLPLRVRNLYLECIPGDSSYKHEEEAAKLGMIEYQKIIVPVSRKSADETYRVYEEALALRDKTITDGYAPVCKDRWSNRNIQDLRCKHYCQVREECMAFSRARGESHPLAPLPEKSEEVA